MREEQAPALPLDLKSAQICLLSRRRGDALDTPPLWQNNSLSDQGLGGPWKLAIAKRPPQRALLLSIRVLEIPFLTFCARFLGGGVGEPSSQEGPPT